MEASKYRNNDRKRGFSYYNENWKMDEEYKEQVITKTTVLDIGCYIQLFLFQTLSDKIKRL